MAVTRSEIQPRMGKARRQGLHFGSLESEMGIGAELRLVVEEGQTLSTSQAQALLGRILAGEASDLELASLLGGMGARGETAAELAGFALPMREAAKTLPLTEAERDQLVDTCGTGGDRTGTFNISTAAALVAAAAGVKIAKHGNRAVTSRCGSADVLEALGVPIALAPETAAEALRQCGFCFLLAPAHHPAMKAMLPVRRALGVRTIFNVLGPLLNPAGARRQVMGVYAARLVPVVAKAMVLLGVHRALVVHGEDGLDELSLSGASEVAEVNSAAKGEEIRTYRITPEEVGLERAPLSALRGGETAQENAQILKGILALDGMPPKRGPGRDIVLLNAAAVFVAAGRAPDISAGVELAAGTIDSGAVRELVIALRQFGPA